jgi:hypothetical protein
MGSARPAHRLVAFGAALAVGCATGGDGVWHDDPAGDDAGPAGLVDAGAAADAPTHDAAFPQTDASTTTGAGDAGPVDTGTVDDGGGGGAEATEGCSPSSCTGCCSQGACITTSVDALCGVSGVACVDCTASSQHCSAGTCVTATSPPDSGSTPPPDAGTTCSAPYAHDDGLNSISSAFSDCVPPSVDSALAQDECLHNASSCYQACPGSDGGGPTAWCGSGFYGCNCWSYAGATKGTVAANGNCACPTAGGNAYH